MKADPRNIFTSSVKTQNSTDQATARVEAPNRNSNSV